MIYLWGVLMDNKEEILKQIIISKLKYIEALDKDTDIPKDFFNLEEINAITNAIKDSDGYLMINNTEELSYSFRVGSKLIEVSNLEYAFTDSSNIYESVNSTSYDFNEMISTYDESEFPSKYISSNDFDTILKNASNSKEKIEISKLESLKNEKFDLQQKNDELDKIIIEFTKENN